MSEPTVTTPEPGGLSEQVPRDLIERCLRLRDSTGVHKVPADARNIIRAAMDAYLAAVPTRSDGLAEFLDRPDVVNAAIDAAKHGIVPSDCGHATLACSKVLARLRALAQGGEATS